MNQKSSTKKSFKIRSFVRYLVGILSNDYGDFNENGKKAKV